MRAAAGNDLATACRGHARAEAMTPLADDFARLISALHGSSPPLFQGLFERSAVSKGEGWACQPRAVGDYFIPKMGVIGTVFPFRVFI